MNDAHFKMKGVLMKSEDIKLEELVEFSEGLLSLKGRRLVLHDLHSFAQFRKDLITMVGPNPARRILTRFGYFWGHADAAAMKRIFEWDDLAEWIKAGPHLSSLEGVAKTVVRELDMDPESGAFHMEVVCYDSGEAEEYLLEFGKAESPVCWILSGYASGYTSFCMEKNIYFIEHTCRAAGNRICAITGRDLVSWGDEIKPHLTYFEAEDIQGKVKKLTVELRKKSQELARQRKQLSSLPFTPQPFLVEVRSTAFGRVLDLAARVAPFDTSILVTGETGVGKEVVSRYIHRLSHRATGPFVGVNCSALPETLLESELFGHKAGSFTGAIRDRIGLFEQAEKGTIFLDEIGDISPAMQTKLLRVLQEHEIMRVGESKTRKVDARVIAATNRNLTEEVERGRFREDLLYRLRVIEIEIPPLRQRPEDILPLARFFVGKFSKKLRIPQLRLDAACLNYLQEYEWPGNVRELENAIERAAVLSREGVILPEYLPPGIVHAASASVQRGDPLEHTLEDVERAHIRAVLKRTKGNRTETARALGISPATLWRKLKAMGEE